MLEIHFENVLDFGERNKAFENCELDFRCGFLFVQLLAFLLFAFTKQDSLEWPLDTTSNTSTRSAIIH